VSGPTRIVVIEDEVPIRRFLRASLTPEEAEFFEAGTGEEGIRLVAQKSPDLVLLDLGLPDIDGLEVVRRLREWTAVPIIVISARGQEKDKIAALDAGADDYLTKPFALGELMARMRVAQRHFALSQHAVEKTFESNGLRVDFESRQVFVDGREVRLTPTEYRLVALLARHAGKVLTHNQILREVWGQAYEDSTHTLRVHMGTVRQKIEADPARPKFVRTETGIGYRLMLE
jgi:two-component system KDP operon response regulator KdpE